MSTAHTPGPWSVRFDDGYDKHPPLLDDDELPRVTGIYAANGDLIVETDSGVYPPRRADAILIAAAPEMLEALQGLYGSVLGMRRIGKPEGMTRALWAAIDQAKLAIAKAAGGGK